MAGRGEGRRMRAAECRERAREAMESAEKEPIDRLREEHLKLATKWLQLAEELDEMDSENRRYG